jgi:hypothetical protein
MSRQKYGGSDRYRVPTNVRSCVAQARIAMIDVGAFRTPLPYVCFWPLADCPLLNDKRKKADIPPRAQRCRLRSKPKSSYAVLKPNLDVRMSPALPSIADETASRFEI